MQRRSVCWLLQQLTGFDSPSDVLCELYFRILWAGDCLKRLVVEGVAGGNPVPFLGHSQLATFL